MKATKCTPVRLLMALLISGMSPIMADFNAVLNSCSKPCQLTAESCKQDSQRNHPDRTDNCVLLTSTVDGITAFQCLVRYGFCTENEFILLKNEACGGKDPQKTVSTATSVLYQELNTTSVECQSNALACVKQSSVATVLKQQEYYCDLLNIQSAVTSSSACLKSCSEAEFNRIKAAACKYSPTRVSPFAKAVMEASAACKVTMDTCSTSSLNAFEGIQREEYCLAMTYKGGSQTTEGCLVGNAKCTQDEFTRLKDGACVPNTARLIFPAVTTLFYVTIVAASFNKLIFRL